MGYATIRVLALAAVCAGAPSCKINRPEASNPRVAASPPLPAIAPLSELEGVRLGMLLFELRRTRPNVVSAPWIGLRETVGRDTIRYHFPEGPPRNVEDKLTLEWIQPGDDAPLVGIHLVTSFATPIDAELAWSVQVQAMRAWGDLKCVSYEFPYRALAAVSRAGAIVSGAVLHSPIRIGERQVPATLRIFVTTNESKFLPTTATAQPRACPDN